MKKYIITAIVIICLVISVILFWIKVGSQEVIDNESSIKLNSNIEETNGNYDDKDIIPDNVAVIKDGKIYNENIINDFIKADKTEEMELNIVDEGKNISIKFIAPTEPQSGENGYDIGDGTVETRKKIFGYYVVSMEGEEKQREFTNIDHRLVKVISNDKVVLCFDAPFIKYISNDYLEICKYDLSSSGYSKGFNLIFHQRKDMGIKEVFDYGEYKVKTFGGDVDIVINDKTYSLEEVLTSKILTPEDILNQAKLDNEYGYCQYGYYEDGGSTEYCYYGEQNNQYTILKLNTLDGEKDLVIGMAGPILANYNKQK